MSRAQDCGMSPYGTMHQNYIPIGNAFEPPNSVLHRSAWQDAVLIAGFLAEGKWQDKKPARWEDDQVEGEIEEMVRKMDQVPMNRGTELDIHNEAVDFTPRFENVCLFDGHSHPRTYRLVQTVSQIGWFVVQYFKDEFKRLRPSRVDARKIHPIIRVPSHPSFPSGHATQSRLVGRALIDIMGLQDADPSDKALKERIEQVAREIGVNRERAGVHYPSDTAAGVTLGDDVYELIEKYVPLHDLILSARAEWCDKADR